MWIVPKNILPKKDKTLRITKTKKYESNKI